MLSYFFIYNEIEKELFRKKNIFQFFEILRLMLETCFWKKLEQRKSSPDFVQSIYRIREARNSLFPGGEINVHERFACAVARQRDATRSANWRFANPGQLFQHVPAVQQLRRDCSEQPDEGPCNHRPFSRQLSMVSEVSRGVPALRYNHKINITFNV